MQAVVKTPRTEVTIKGEISSTLLKALKKEFGRKLRIEKSEESIPWRDTEFFKENKEFLQPGSKLKYYRKKAGLSLTELGDKLGGIPRQNLSAMELGKRPISKDLAKQLAKLFKKPVEVFLYAE
ncbi:MULTISPECIES: helix-turn-helix transcriptional regulator [Leptospira]|uniref:DNA-binding helix-turn-helix protein n=1 Tax=Leptospira weilii str. UI 13098 TaxID=1088542 RepID=M6Q8R7_9LEPT|nr:MULTISPECIES: helix-turn-helix transcriptional regulator [Leptospira]EMN92016.1 DNA-binding helix-turn-helix protein [Leptospira weilii str. UI 13098]MCL8268651.1 helix-turn-helix domain-containing protein [Leptospira weilii]OMI15135.1 transcriptional regulator [Leptospira weilii serovar Heyan]ULH26783.1 helix-turn-helix domain-containing protein [Leptospira weilii]ULH30751.1 helix-turn-helix domain-containing protein [Leptospira weilii]